ncbi:MAG: amidohydrolase family protein, partial [Clostridia bacterium]|nr:amidohydrolase family protein [Clostridia bacterium]
MDLRTVYTGCQVFKDGCLQYADISVQNGIVDAIGEVSVKEADTVVSLSGKYVFPGFADVHVHFREPGFSYKETIETGSKAAAAGGYTLVGTMPNLNPAPDTIENVQKQLDLIHKNAVIDVVPYGTISMERKGKILSDMEAIADKVIGFSDDGSGV